MKNYISDNHFEYDKLMERLDNDVELISQLLDLTKGYLTDFIPILENLISKSDVKGLKSHIHKMKGTALAVCFHNFAKQNADFELIENYNNENYFTLKEEMITEINYLIKMIDGKSKAIVQ
jgi:hypothetical protein